MAPRVATFAQVVNAAASGTVVASSANPSVAGTSVTFTATVTGTAPTGTVVFSADGTTLSGCSAVVLPAGSASSKIAACTTSLAAGRYNIVATYGGDSGNATSTSSSLTQAVLKASSRPGRGHQPRITDLKASGD